MGKLNVCGLFANDQIRVKNPYVKKIVLPNLGSTTNYRRLLYKKIDIAPV